jgi:circadian clock protein KaiC
MARSKKATSSHPEGIRKSPTGINGFDEITAGGLPTGRPTLVCGGPGCGKTLFAMQFLVSGATRFGEPGVFMSFEENAEELTQNVASLGFDLAELRESGRIAMDFVQVQRDEIEETGSYDLEGLFVRLGYAIQSVGAKRVVLDTIEALFSGLSNTAVLRAELRRLFRWLKDRGVTVVITGERGDGKLTRQGLEEYVSDCVILLDHRVNEQISTRRLRIVKYRGSVHGTNEYPFLIDERGLEVLPITSLHLQHEVSSERISSGIDRLDAMLGGQGYYRGSSVLVSGSSGTGKSSLAAHFVDAGCRRGERCLYFSMEESEGQIIRNMGSIGLPLGKWIQRGLLRVHSSRPTLFGLEMHLVTVYRMVQEFKPSVVVIDPMSNFVVVGTGGEVQVTLLRLVDYLKSQGITALFTNLTSSAHAPDETQLGVSSLMDTWILLQELEDGGERNRGLYVLKSRGMAHSNQVREFVLTGQGIQLLDVYVGPGGVLTGSARLSQEARERAEGEKHRQEIEALRRRRESRRLALEAQIATLRAEFEGEEEELIKRISQGEQRERTFTQDRASMARSRQADTNAGNGKKGRSGKAARRGERSA